jgi:hypothetical protein
VTHVPENAYFRIFIFSEITPFLPPNPLYLNGTCDSDKVSDFEDVNMPILNSKDQNGIYISISSRHSTLA